MKHTCSTFLALILCSSPVSHAANDRPAQHPRVEDLGLTSGFQGSWGNHYGRGRALIAADFDGDGRVDSFVGNVSDESWVVRNLALGPGHIPRFEPAELLLPSELAFVASAADYDNDGDLDLFVGCGGLEGYCLDYLFRNDSTPGRIAFTDVSREAGIRGPTYGGPPLPHATGGATWGDYDRDGDADLFVSVLKSSGAVHHKSVLWRNNGDGTFRDATHAVNLDYVSASAVTVMLDWGYFQNSTWIDVDNDGDLDLFQNNGRGPNVLWQNFSVESFGSPAWFEERTSLFSLPGEDLRYPFHSFASAVADFNNDGWQDLMLFNSDPEPTGANASPYGTGHALFLNRQGQGFYNAAAAAGILMPGGPGADTMSAMGCQLADLDADGVPDIVLGGGGPVAGGAGRLLLSSGQSGEIPLYEDATHLIDFEPTHGIDPASPPFPEVPPYPYRTHGIAAADFDGDGRLELGVLNGGRAADPPIVREPDRLFDFEGPGVGRTLRAELRGNGRTDGRDAIGARAYVEVATPHGVRRVFQTVLAGSGFSAQNELTLTFGLGRDHAARLLVLWPSGCVQVVPDLPRTDGCVVVVEQACWRCDGARRPVASWLDPEAASCAAPAADEPVVE